MTFERWVQKCLRLIDREIGGTTYVRGNTCTRPDHPSEWSVWFDDGVSPFDAVDGYIIRDSAPPYELAAIYLDKKHRYSS